MKKRNRYQRVRLDSGQHRRIRLTAAVLGLGAFVPVVLGLWCLMIRDHDRYAALALGNQTRATSVAGTRGMIFDRNMNVLSGSRSVEDVYLDPQELRQSGADIPALSRVLGQLLGKDPEWIQQQASDRRLRYKKVGSRVDKQTAGAIRQYILQTGIRGIHLEPGSQRVYPYGTLAAQVLGFTDGSGRGAEGLEAFYNSFLEGKAGKVITTKGSNEMDMPFSYEGFLEARPGSSLVLTLDVTVQACLENRLAEAIAKYDVRNGAFGLVMEVNTGQILAMATLGSYDPNQYLQLTDPEDALAVERLHLEYLTHPDSQEAKQRWQEALKAARLKQWRNRCISDGYEPGSTFKVLTLAAALDSGAVTPESRFFCAGAQQIPGRAQLLHCWRSAGHGSQKTPQALQNSCNLAFANIALQLGGETFYRYMERFGILEKTGIDLAGESGGIFFPKTRITDTDKWGTASLTSGSFGQTFKITPLQLVRAIASVVNGGLLPEPYLVAQVLDSDGRTLLQQEPTVTRRTVSPETSALMRSLMESVVTEGTAKNAAVPGYAIGGKTGTSEKIDVLDENGRPVTDKIVSFVGVAPMEDPQYIVLAALDTPSRETGIYISGGVMAAPTVGAIFGDILPYLGVEKAETETVKLPDLTGQTRAEAEKTLKGIGLTGVFQGIGETVTYQLPQPDTQVEKDTQVLLYLSA